ncbi:hypothetical protein NDA01_21815 [Trichocoleus desertorum AS-A10]|uniref:hypothetical protein n=1 Tax=Trichocoleus desertorum TaxID=1481672 RepID=UPI003299C8FE
MKRTVQSQWQSYERSIMPKDAPPIQRKEMRRAFYAGAFVMLNLAKEVGDMSEEAGVEALEAYERECKEFLSRVGIDH